MILRFALFFGLLTTAAVAFGQAAPAPALDSPPAAPNAEDKAWREALSGLVPVTPEQVQESRVLDEAVERAARPRFAPDKALSEALTISLEPGAESPVVDLLHGFSTAIEVLDATGQPWPVVEATQGDETAVSVKIVGAAERPQTAAESTEGGGSVPAVTGSTGSVLTVTPGARFSATNLILVLQGASRPISLILRSEEAKPKNTLRDRITLIVGGQGPNARGGIASGYQHLDAGVDLRNALVGRQPDPNAQEILAELPSGMRAWRAGTTLWIRSRDALISPAPIASVAMGEYRAYRLNWLPVVVTSSAGSLQNVALTESAMP